MTPNETKTRQCALKIMDYCAGHPPMNWSVGAIADIIQDYQCAEQRLRGLVFIEDDGTIRPPKTKDI